MLSKLISVSIFLFTIGCSHQVVEQDVSQKMNQESDVKSQADLSTKVTLAFENAKGISSDQRRRLFDLRNTTRQQLEDNWQAQLKLKSVMIKEIVQTDYKENEVELIKSKLKDLESKRLSIMFGSVDEANRIMGRQARLNDDVMRDFIRIEHD